MSAVAAHYASASAAAAAATDRRYADLTAHYDPSAFFHYSPPSLNTVTAPPLDANYSLGHSAPSSSHSYPWDAHHPAVQSPSPYSAPSASSASSNTYHPHPSSPSAAGHSSAAVSFGYTAQTDYALPSHRSYPSTRAPAHHASTSLSSSNASSTSTYSSRLQSRDSYASGTRSYSALAIAAAATAAASATTGSSSTPRLQNASWDSTGLYTIEPDDPVSNSASHHAYSHSAASTTPSTPSTPPVKEEEPESEFIIEVSVPADPVPSTMAKVPLRATNACPAQRKLMCTFRLESFAMHDGIRSAATQPGSGGVEIGPLKEPGIELEWQAQLSVPLIPDEEDASSRYATTRNMSQETGASATSPTLLSSKTAQVGRTSPRRATRASDSFAAAGSASPTLSLESYTPTVDSETWDGSGYTFADDGSAGTTAGTGRQTFAPIMTPAQSLGWSLRYQSGEAELRQSGYHRQHITQPSLSRVSQTQSRYILGDQGLLKQSYHQPHPQAQYEYDNRGYSRSGGTAGRYAEAYF
ncbi:hypothetical protein BD414DRAFT_517135 [Trametes punicea]|nr:hypothetical protein BD414DRAFT_517135 [Trametes punicea]